MTAAVLSANPAVAVACADQLGAAGHTATVVISPSGLASLLGEGTEIDVLVVVGPPAGSKSGAAAASLAAATEAMELVVAPMQARGYGRIVFVVPVTGLPGGTWADGSGAGAWGTVGLARTAARELAATGITVNVVRSGLIDTGEAAVDPAVVAGTPLKRAGSPADVAAAVAFLASADAGYVTGLVLPVDGGLTMGLGA
ncbi:SDR family oxidoreductase [Aquihabitans sp. McL0605]|uniref:SDR family oxidoreductase n=1 Tax=Aquihabitans sp. McL0605 TaxID=3415671 RepID=UPI003CE77BA4